MEIKTVQSKEKLKEIFNFLSRLFYEDAKEYNEHYYIMSERFKEMSIQFEKGNELLLLYIEENGEIIASLTSKGMDIKSKKITLGIIGVTKKYRQRGYAEILIKEFEKICKIKEILHIDLGARFRACSLYKKMGYTPSLMVQVFDFETIENVRKVNRYNLKEKSSYQEDTYGFIFFDIPDINEKYIKCFENSLSTTHVQFIFEKDL